LLTWQRNVAKHFASLVRASPQNVTMNAPVLNDLPAEADGDDDAECK